MDVDIRIYLQKLKDFFNTDKEAFRDMFGHGKIDMEEFYRMVADKATINMQKNGDPMLSSTELLGIVTDLAFKEVTEEIDIQNFIEKNPIKSKVTGKIVDIDEKSMKVDLNDQVFGYIKKINFSKDKLEQKTERVHIHDSMYIIVLQFNSIHNYSINI